MSGWTSQMKVYVPAASAGTWYLTFELDTMSPLKTFAPPTSEMAMLCGAPSWLSKSIANAVPALTATAGVTNFRSLATTATVAPLGPPAGELGCAACADALDQAPSTAASASRPKVRVRRFMSVTPVVSVGPRRDLGA